MAIQKQVENAIRKLRDKYIIDGLVNCYKEINNGFCPEFAEEIVYDYLNGEAEIISTDDLMIDNNDDLSNIWDKELLKIKWNTELPPNISSEVYHVWIYSNGKHYDAECPEGVNNIFDLPLFKKQITANETGFLSELRKDG